MSFNLDDYLREHPNQLSSTQWEKYLSSPKKPKWLEDVNIAPEKALGEGSYKNYMHERANRLPDRPSVPPYSPIPPADPFAR